MITKELVGASSIPIILSILAQKESYGYEIIQRVKELSDGKIEWGDGTLYPVLHKLEKKGFLQSDWKTVESGRRRKYYRISEDGKRELVTEQKNWTIINDVIQKLWKSNPSFA